LARRLVQFAPQSWQLYSAAEDGLVRCWDLKANKLARTLTGHMGMVRAIQFDGDRNHIVT
jgi:WD40 repeat protein